MVTNIAEIAEKKLVIFYDELSHFNPVYSAPTEETRISIDNEVEMHINNLRILSLVFDNVLIMLGNILNFPNHTTKAVVTRVLQHAAFVDLREKGIVRFAGWGGATPGTMIDRQIAYAEKHRPELKDRETVARFRETILSTDLILRDLRDGEFDLTPMFRERLSINLDSINFDDRKRLLDVTDNCISAANYVGTMELFQAIERFSPKEIQLTHLAYFDAWTSYAASHYAPALVYENPKRGTNPRRSVRSPHNADRQIAAAFLSPHFLWLFFRQFLNRATLVALLSNERLACVRANKDVWWAFQHCYITIVEECSTIYWGLLATQHLEGDAGQHIFLEQSLSGLIENGIEAERLEFVFQVLNRLATITSPVPGGNILIDLVKRTFSNKILEGIRASNLAQKQPELFAFLKAVRTCAMA